jgi:hypothetical protein
MGFLELVETAGGQACVTACGTTKYTEQEEKTAKSPYLFNSTADPVSIKLDIVFLQHLPLHGFKNEFVADVLQELNSNNSLCSSKKSTYHKLSICRPYITNDLSIHSEAIQDELRCYSVNTAIDPFDSTICSTGCNLFVDTQDAVVFLHRR